MLGSTLMSASLAVHQRAGGAELILWLLRHSAYSQVRFSPTLQLRPARRVSEEPASISMHSKASRGWSHSMMLQRDASLNLLDFFNDRTFIVCRIAPRSSLRLCHHVHVLIFLLFKLKRKTLVTDVTERKWILVLFDLESCQVLDSFIVIGNRTSADWTRKCVLPLILCLDTQLSNASFAESVAARHYQWRLWTCICVVL